MVVFGASECGHLGLLGLGASGLDHMIRKVRALGV